MCNQTQQSKSPMTRNASETATDETIHHEKDARLLRSYIHCSAIHVFEAWIAQTVAE
jgi:hypothetical protein